MKRLTIDIEHVKLPIKQLERKFSLQKKLKNKIFKRQHFKLTPKKPKDIRKFIEKEHSYVKTSDSFTPCIPKSVILNPFIQKSSDQLSHVPSQAKVNMKYLMKSQSPSPKKSIGNFKDGGIVSGCLIESNDSLFHATVKEIILKIQSAVDIDGECIIRKIIKHLGESWVLSKFIPIKVKSDQNGYLNFMQLSSDMNTIFSLMKKNLQILKMYRALNSLCRLERIFYSEVVGHLAVDKALGRILYPLYATPIINTPSKPVNSPKLKKWKKMNKNTGVVEQFQNTSTVQSTPIVILSDDDKNEANLQPGPDLPSIKTTPNNHAEPSKLPPIPTATEPPRDSTASPTHNAIQIRSEESEEGYTVTTTLKKPKSNKPRGEFENYMRFLVEKYLDKDTAITAQKKENLEMVIKQASVMYPEQYHDVRKRIRSILRNTRRNKSRHMIRNLQDFGNSNSFNDLISPSTPQLSGQKESSRQIVMPQPHSNMLSPFASFTQQSTFQPSISSSITTISSPSFFGTDISKRTQGVRFKIPQHLEVLQPPPLVSVEGDLAKQFALYNYIASQKDSDGYHLCSHFLEHTSNKDENVRLKQPIDMRTIALKIKICWYSSLKDLVKDFELMLDNNIKLHQLRSFVGRDALKLRQLMTNMVKELMNGDVVDLTSLNNKTKEDNSSKNTSKLSTKEQNNSFFQALENYRDANSRVLLFTFLFPPSGLKLPIDEKNFITLTDVKLNLKNNTYPSLSDLAHSVLRIIHTFLSVYMPNSQAFRDSEEMAKYVLRLYKEQTGESMQVSKTIPQQYVLPGRKGQFMLALQTADFLEISYNRLFQCFTIIPVGESEIQVLCAQGMRHTSVPIIHLVPFREVEGLINQKLKYTNSDTNQEISADPISPIPHLPTQSTPTQPMPSLTKMFNSIKFKPASKLSSYHFPSLMFKQYVIKRELCQFLNWSEETFEILFHSLRQIRAGQAEKDHLFRVYKIHENHKYPFFLIFYDEIKELESMGEKSRGNKLIADIFRKDLPLGILKSSNNKWSKFLHFVDDRSNIYFIIRELMNKMNVTLQDMMLIMKFKVFQLDELQGLIWIREWEDIVNKIQKNPRYLESMVCLYNGQLEMGLAELDSISRRGQVKGKTLLNKFFQKVPSLMTTRPDPITISSPSEDDERREIAIQSQGVPEKEEQYVSLDDLATYLRWSQAQAESVFGKDQQMVYQHGSKFLPFSQVNRILENINYASKNYLNVPSFNAATNKDDPPRLWTLPNLREKHLILEDLGSYADIPMDVLETSYQVYIYDVKSDKDKIILAQQGLNMMEYVNKPIRMIDQNKVKWILDMKAKKETINFRSRTKEKKKVPKSSKKDHNLKELSIQVTKTQVDPMKMYKYNVFQLLTVECKILTVDIANKRKIKMKIIDAEKLRKPHSPLKTYTVGDKELVISHHLAEYTHIPQSNLFLFLLSYGVTYYSNTAPTAELRTEFERYNFLLKTQGLPKYKNVTFYPCDELEQLLGLRKIGFTNLKLIETYNQIQTTNEKILIIALASNNNQKAVIKRGTKDAYSIEFKIHTIRDPESGKTVILKVFDDHYLYKPREQIMVYQVQDKENGKVSLVLLHDLARFTNIPLTRLQMMLDNYFIPSFSMTSGDVENQDTFVKYFTELHNFGLPHYMKHTTLYQLEHLNSLLHLREVGFFNEKLLDVYKMIKLSSEKQKRILLTIKPTGPPDKGAKRHADIPAGSPQTKIPKYSPSSLNKSNENNKKGMAAVPAKSAISKPLPIHYKLTSAAGTWILVSELTYFLNLTYTTLQSKFVSYIKLIPSVADHIELMEQGAKLVVNKMLLLPLYVVIGIIKMKLKGEELQSIRLAIEEIEYGPEEEEDESKTQRSENMKSTIIKGVKASYEDIYQDNVEEFELANNETSQQVQDAEFSIQTLWRNNSCIKLRIPWSYNYHIKSNSSTFPNTLKVRGIDCDFHSVEDISEFVKMGILELKIGLGKNGINCPGGFPNSANMTFLLRATEDFQLFVALRRMGVPKHKFWLVYFACKNITSNEKIGLVSPSKLSEKKIEIGIHTTKLLLAESILRKEVLPRHICPVYNIPGSNELYYIAEEVAVEMQVSLIKLLNTNNLMKYRNIRRKFTDLNGSDKLSFTMIRVDDLQQLSLLYNLGIPGPVALDIFQHLRQLPGSTPQYLHDFTSFCKKGYNMNCLRKWVLLDNTEAVSVEQAASILGVTPGLLERRYHKDCHRIHLNSIEHVFLLAQGFEFPSNSNRCMFTNENLFKDVYYLSKFKPGQIQEILAHKPGEWPIELCPNLVNKWEESERELFIRTVRIDDISIRNPTPHYVVLASDLKQAFGAINHMTVPRLCESVKLGYRDPTSLDCRCLSLQMESLSPDKLASMVLVRLNKHLWLIILLLALGVDIFELWRMVKDSNWASFHENIAVLLTKPEEFDEWLCEYFIERSDQDPRFYDLSQEYPYFLAELVRPPPQPIVITTMRKVLKNTDFLPFWSWKLNSSSYNWVNVESLRNLLPRNELSKSLLRKQNLVSENSNEGRVLLSQGFSFSEEIIGFVKFLDVVNNIDLDQCMSRMLQMVRQRLEAFDGDISLHTFVTPMGRVKVFTQSKDHRKIFLKKYAIATGMMSAKPMVSVDELLSLVPGGQSRSEVESYITDTMNTKTLTRSTAHPRPIKLLKWPQASLFARLIELGCLRDINLFLELHNLLSKQTVNVYKLPLSQQASTSLWFFLEGEYDQHDLKSCDNPIETPDHEISHLADLNLSSEGDQVEAELSPDQEVVSPNEDTQLQLPCSLTENFHLESHPQELLDDSGDNMPAEI